MQIDKKQKSNQTHFAYIFLSLAFLMVMRLLPLLKAPLSFYGYDFGFYWHAAQNAQRLTASDFAAILWGGFNSPLFFLGRLLHVPPAFSTVGIFFLSALFLGLCMYFWLKNQGGLSGVFACLLVALSPIQAESYRMFLWKNALALPFLVLGFKFLAEKKWRPFILCTLIILITHRTTAIIYLLTTSLYLIWTVAKNKKWKLLAALGLTGSLLLIIGYYAFDFKSVVLSLIQNSNFYVRTGLFFENQNFLALFWPVLLLAAAGFVAYVFHKQNVLPVIFALVCALWFILHLPFYRRILIYLDLSIIFFAAYFLGRINYNAKKMKLAAVMVIIFLSASATQFILSRQPLISKQEVAEIKNFRRTPGLVLTVSADDAPWLLAFTDRSQRLGAPGLLEDPHTYQEWTDFWQSRNQRQFISLYPRPLYFFQRSYRLPYAGIAPCLTRLSTNFFEADFVCIEKTPLSE